MQELLFNAVISNDYDVIISGAKLSSFAKIKNADAQSGVTYNNLMSITRSNIQRLVAEYYDSLVSENIENDSELGEDSARESALESLNNLIVEYIPDISKTGGFESVDEIITAIMRCDAFSYWQSKMYARFQSMATARPQYDDANANTVKGADLLQNNNIFTLLETLSSISNDDNY